MSTGTHPINRVTAPFRYELSFCAVLAQWKLLVIVLVLLLEVLIATFTFDSSRIVQVLSPGTNGVPSDLALQSSVSHVSSVTLWFLRNVRLALRAGIVALVIGSLLCGRPFLAAVAKVAVPSLSRYVLATFAGHLAIFGAFMALTGGIFDQDLLASPWGGLALAVWVGLSFAVLASLVACVLPPAHWGALGRQALPAALVAAVSGVAAAWAGQFAGRFWIPLAGITLNLVHSLLSLFETDVVYRPSEFIVGTGAFPVLIAPECSGYEGVGLVLAFLGLYLILFRHQLRFPNALLLLPLGAVAIWLANIVRIFALIEVGTRISRETALSGFHSQAGWIAFNAVALGLVALARYSPFFQTSRAQDPAMPVHAGPSREAVFLGPFVAIVATLMITAAFSTTGNDPLYPLRLVAVALPLWLFRREYAALDWSVRWQSIAIGAFVYLLWIGRSLAGLWATGEVGSHSLNLPAQLAAVWVIAHVIGSVITVPLAEELAFRGFLTRRLISAEFDAIPAGRFTWFSFLLSSVAFGLLHQHWPEGIAAGMLYAIAYYQRGSIGDAVVAHATTNGLLATQALLLGDWSIIS